MNSIGQFAQYQRMMAIMTLLENYNPRYIIWYHFSALERGPNDITLASRPRLRISTILRDCAVPLASGSAVGVLKFPISTEVSSSILLVSGVLAAFSFQASVQMFERSVALHSDDVKMDRDEYNYGLLLHDVAASSSYAVLISLATAILALAVGISTSGWNEWVLASLTVTFVVHLTLTLVSVLVRVFYLTRGKVRRSLTKGRKPGEQ